VASAAFHISGAAVPDMRSQPRATCPLRIRWINSTLAILAHPLEKVKIEIGASRSPLRLQMGEKTSQGGHRREGTADADLCG
jgi:hypothetical protein